jgi:23S rRNA (guanosine2251-2'-O)-methyltransferase
VTPKDQAVFLYGFHPVREALRHRPHQVARVLLSASRTGRRRQEIEELCGRHGVGMEVVSERALAERAGKAHNGMAAEMRVLGVGSGAGAPLATAAATAAAVPAAEVAGAVATAGPAGQLPQRVELGDPQLIVLLEDVQDPRNLGAVLRVCEGSGVGRVLIRDRGAAPLTATVAKTSAGASEWLDIERITNSATEIERLKAAGFWVYGTDAGGEPPWAVDLTGPVVLCFGGEEHGLRERTRSLCDRTIGLPMRGRVGSLNLSTAAAAVLYEAVRQRQGRAGTSR